MPLQAQKKLRWIQVITSIPFWTITLFEGEPYWPFFLCWRICSCLNPSSQGIPLWRAGRSRSLTFPCGFSLRLCIELRATHVSSRALTFCCALYALSTVCFSFALRRALGCSCARGGLFKLSFTKGEIRLTYFLFQVSDRHIFRSGVVSRFNFWTVFWLFRDSNGFSCSDCWKLTVIEKFSKFPRQFASSSRFWCHPIVFQTTVHCHSSSRPSKSRSVCRHQSFLSTDEVAHLALQENEQRFDTQASRFPSCGCEQSAVLAHVATAEFLMNFRTHHTCLSKTNSDNVILQQETDTRQLMSQIFNLFGLGLVVELLTSAVEHPADILADAREFAFGVFEVQPLLQQASPLVFQCVACDAIHVIQ